MVANLRTTKSLLTTLITQRIVLGCIFMLMYTSLTSSTTIIELKFIQFGNPTHKELNGGCCELLCWDFLDIGVCENYISLCIDDINSTSDSMDVCPHYKMANFHKGDDDFYFPSKFDNHQPNPIVFSVEDYKGGVRVKLDVWDKDNFLPSLNSDDHIDIYNEEIKESPSKSVNSAVAHYHTLFGSGYSQTRIEVKAYCADNYYGTNCLVYCSPNDNDVDGHYTCDPDTGDKICLPGYTGPLCKIDIDECESSPCQNGGTCRDYLNYFMCECTKGTTGIQCEITLNKCYSGSCNNGGTCVDSSTGFDCECADGFEGKFCEAEKDECQSNPCQNNGTCEDSVNGFQCKCRSGYNGTLCEADHDACTSSPCYNGATCTNTLNGYACNCTEGFFGVHCEVSLLLLCIMFLTAVVVVVVARILLLTVIKRYQSNFKSSDERKSLLFSV